MNPLTIRKRRAFKRFATVQSCAELSAVLDELLDVTKQAADLRFQKRITTTQIRLGKGEGAFSRKIIAAALRREDQAADKALIRRIDCKLDDMAAR